MSGDGEGRPTHRTKGENVSNQYTLYQRVAAEHTAAFRTGITWYSNGERGHLHHSAYCDKIARSRTTTVNRTLALRDALERHVCSECIGRGDLTDDQREIVKIAGELRQLERQINMMHANPIATPAGGAVETYRRHIFYQRAAESLENIDPSGKLPGLKQEISANIVVPARPEDSAIREETLHYTVGQTFWKLLSRDDEGNPYWGGHRIVRLLGRPTWRDWSNSSENVIARTGRFWTDLLQKGHAPQEATRMLMEPNVLAGILSEPQWEMLQHCSDLEAPEPGENLRTYASRVWRARATEALTELTASWEQRVAGLVAPAAPVVIASDSMMGRGIEGLLCGTEAPLLIAAVQEHVLRQGDRNERIAVVCHPTIGEYLANLHGRSGWSQPVAAPTENLHEVLDTALALWDPWNRDGSYHQFPQALEAAVHV